MTRNFDEFDRDDFPAPVQTHRARLNRTPGPTPAKNDKARFREQSEKNNSDSVPPRLQAFTVISRKATGLLGMLITEQFSR